MNRKAVWSLSLSLLMLFLTGWVVASLYNFVSQIVNYSSTPQVLFEATLNLVPFLTLAIFSAILYALYFYKKKRKQTVSPWLFPLEFSEQDEREKDISAEACRKAFVTTWIAAPIVAVLFVGFPLVEGWVPYLPIFIILLIPAIQAITYFVHIRKI